VALANLTKKEVQACRNEATLLSGADHPYVVKYFDSFSENQYLYILMEYCENGDLSQYLKKQPQLSEEVIWKFLIQISLGLQHLHQSHVMHRDLKALNLFLTKDLNVRIGDLGIAKAMKGDDLAMTMVGTPYYLAPEICEGRPYSNKTDVWALGCVLYEMCARRHPFEAKNQAELVLKIVKARYDPIPKQYSKELAEIVAMCMSKEPATRPEVS